MCACMHGAFGIEDWRVKKKRRNVIYFYQYTLNSHLDILLKMRIFLCIVIKTTKLKN